MELFEPMLCAIAAGCTTILKPSELAPASEKLIAEIVPKYLDQSAIRVVTAGPKEMNYLLERNWDHIFFTGSTAVGKIIYAKAAPNLTTVTLELGGRGPAIVTPSADIDLAAKRIANVKFMNAGQICVGVNHVFVDPSIKQKFIAALSKYFDEYRSGQARQPAYATRIINERHYKRLDNLLEKTQGKVVYGGERKPRDALLRHPQSSTASPPTTHSSPRSSSAPSCPSWTLPSTRPSTTPSSMTTPSPCTASPPHRPTRTRSCV
ncbi:hypothetical protein J3459_010004 [Metarhizium acridum]|nr:hypothetical protein J3459_010004 [Metarhizium acridum]